MQKVEAGSHRDGSARRGRGYPLSASMLILFAVSASAGEINACKFLQVLDFANDPYGIAQELRTQASAHGFVVVSTVPDVPPAEFSKVCVMSGSWSAGGTGGQVAMRVADASGSLVAEATARATAWLTVGRTVRGAVSKIYSQLGYSGFDEEVYRARIQREYPTRPKLVITEEAIKRGEPRSQVEGIWSDGKDKYRLGIVPAPEGSGADYVAVILRSNTPLWQPGEIKAEIRSTATPEIFTCTYYMGNKRPVGISLSVDHNSALRGSLPTPKGSEELLLMRVWPNIRAESGNSTSASGGSSGTGFPLTQSGLIATNWHVVADAKNLTVAFPGSNGSISAEVVVRDKLNDLAILRMTDVAKLATACHEIPFQLASANGTKLGEHVSAIGYPLSPMLGSNPKFTEGVVSSKSGWQDDPRTLQISAQVQPGSSGSPLFDHDGNIVGVVVATLDAAKVYQAASAIPQNVNYAIKADYLLSLLSMVPGESPAPRATDFSPDKAAQCVALIRAW